MDQIKLLLKTYIRTDSVRKTSKICKMSRNTVKQYINLFKAQEQSFDFFVALSDEKLHEYVQGPTHEDLRSERRKIFDLHISDWLEQLKGTGVTRQLLWEKYVSEHGSNAYKYSQFCERFAEHSKRNKVTISLSHKPGEVLQMDFAGKTLSWIDKSTGEVHDCQIFVAVMPFSQHTFAIALPSQKVEDFVHGINEAMIYMGCRPNVLLCDNLKSYVTKSDKYCPTFNQLAEQLADHYELELRATRVRKPKDKASVEGAVRICYQRIYAPLRDEIFYSIEELNEAIRYQLDLHNAMEYQKKQGSRKSHFEDYEKPYMRELPSEIFKIKRIAKATVQKNYHVSVTELNSLFSVPYRYVGEKVMVRYDRKMVEIFINGSRVCTHTVFDTYMKYYTMEDHLPSNHQEWNKSQGYDGDHFRARAEKIGEDTLWLINYILEAQTYEVQAYKTCGGVLALTRDYTPHRVEQAASRCKEFNRGGLSIMRNILSKNLDQQGIVRTLNIPDHPNIRGGDQY